MNRRKMREMLYLTAFSIVLSGTAFPSNRDAGDVSLLTYDTTEGILNHRIEMRNDEVSDISLSAAGTNLGDNSYFTVDDFHADEFPDVYINVSDLFYTTDRGYVPDSNYTDCIVVNGYSYDYLCDRPGWNDSVPAEMFPARLEYLGLNDTGLAYYPAASFANKSVLFLEINNHLDSFSLDPQVFQGLIGTQVLHIQGNIWGDIDSFLIPFFGMFAPLEELTQLKLEFNMLEFTGIDAKVVKDGPTVMPKLDYLSLKGNFIGRIEDYLFYPLRDSPITELNLNTAGIASIGEHAFEHLPHLRHVDLFNNPKLVTNYEELHITTIPDLTAALLPLLNQNFTNLGIGSMDLTSIPHRTLDSVADDLVRLNMAKNNIANLGNKANSDPDRWSFPNMEALETLILADSGIEEIDGHPFANLTNLKYLDVSGNKMHKIFEGLLVPSLVWLDVSSQCQGVEQFLEICLDEFTIEYDIFNQSSNLRSLNMGNVLLQSVQPEYFTGLVNLEILYLDHTDLERIQDGSFDDMRKLKQLYLNNNEDLTGLSQSTFEALTNLEILDLAYSSKAFTRFRDDPVVMPVVVEPSDDLRIVTSTSTSTTKTTMTTTTSTTTIKKDEFIIPSLRFLRQLNLRNTQDRDCAENEDCWNALLLESLPSLEFMDLSENFIESWKEDFFTERCPNLTTLYLRSNELTNMWPAMISTFEHISELDLTNNDFVCSDEIADFHQMTLDRVNELHVIDYDGGEGYFCLKDDNQPAVSFKQYYDDAKQAELLRLLYGALAGILFIILAVACYVIYHNRYLLSYKVLKARRRFSTAAVDRSFNNNYDYDVFVCYSKEERGWVTNEFLPALESGEPGIRACVHERDFEVGLTVIDNIVTCVERSRRFLMILSSGFGNSQWCMFEVHLAQQRLLAEDKSSFLVVVRDRPPSLNKTLKTILSNWTYLKWPDLPEEKEEFYFKLKSSILRPKSSSRLRF